MMHGNTQARSTFPNPIFLVWIFLAENFFFQEWGKIKQKQIIFCSKNQENSGLGKCQPLLFWRHSIKLNRWKYCIGGPWLSGREIWGIHKTVTRSIVLNSGEFKILKSKTYYAKNNTISMQECSTVGNLSLKSCELLKNRAGEIKRTIDESNLNCR